MGRITGLHTQNAGQNRRRRDDAAEQEAEGSGQSPQAGSHRGGHEREHGQRPDFGEAGEPAQGRDEGDGRVNEPEEAQEKILEIENRRVFTRAHEGSPDERQEKHGDTRGDDGADAPYAEGARRGGHAENGLPEGADEVEDGERAPVALLHETAQEADGQNDGHGHHGGHLVKAAPVRGRVMRRADDRRKPCSGHAVQPDVAGSHGCSGCGQNHDALLAGTAFLPFCFAVFSGSGRVEYRFAGQGLSHVEEECFRPRAFGDGLQVKAQPAGARAGGKGFRPESREFLVVFGLRHLVNVHGGGGIGQDAQVGSENEVLVPQD